MYCLLITINQVEVANNCCRLDEYKLMKFRNLACDSNILQKQNNSVVGQILQSNSAFAIGWARLFLMLPTFGILSSHAPSCFFNGFYPK